MYVGTGTKVAYQLGTVLSGDRPQTSHSNTIINFDYDLIYRYEHNLWITISVVS